MTDDELKPFYLHRQEGQFQVMDRQDNVWLETAHMPTSAHYMDLLNKAYRKGFKQGYRQAGSD